VDVDPQAAQVARQNAAVNGVDLDVRMLDARTGGMPETDVAVANIALDSVEELGGVLRARHAVTSGYLVSEQPMLDGYRIRERRERDGWAADVYERR
jgi:ribosomal protein L11 methylase PrmA